MAWLPHDLRLPVETWLAKGVRLPQELVGTEQLQELESTRPDPDVPF